MPAAAPASPCAASSQMAMVGAPGASAELAVDLTHPAALSKVLSMIVRRQNDQEVASRKLAQWSAMLAALSYSQTRHLFGEQHRLQGQLIAGRAALIALRNRVERQDSDISTLQEQQMATQMELERVQKEIQGKLDAHEVALARQAKEIHRLTRDKLRRALVIDSVIVTLAAVTSQSSIVALPISLVTLPFRSTRLKNTVGSSLHFAVFLSLAYALRKHAQIAGLVPEHVALTDYSKTLFD